MKKITSVLVLTICGILLAVSSSVLRSTQNDLLCFLGFFIIYLITGGIAEYYKLKFHVLLFIPSIIISVIGIMVNHGAILHFIGEVIAVIAGFFTGLYLTSKSFNKVILFGLSSILFLLTYARLIIPQLQYSGGTKSFDQTGKGENFANFMRDSIVLFTESDLQFNNTKFKDKVILIDLWNIHCLPCRQKDKSFKIVADAFKDNNEVLVLSVNSGTSDSYSSFRDFVNKKSVLQGSLFDSGGKLSKIFNAPGYPVEFLFDKKGNLRQRFTGFTADMEGVYRVKTINSINNLLDEK